MEVGPWAYLDLLRELKEALVSRLGVGMMDVLFGVFPLFACTGDVCEVLLVGLTLGSVSGSSTAAKRDRFGEGGGRLHTATNQYRGGLGGRLDTQNIDPLRLGLRPFLGGITCL